jgi:hypothetical protein
MNQFLGPLALAIVTVLLIIEMEASGRLRRVSITKGDLASGRD